MGIFSCLFSFETIQNLMVSLKIVWLEQMCMTSEKAWPVNKTHENDFEMKMWLFALICQQHERDQTKHNLIGYIEQNQHREKVVTSVRLKCVYLEWIFNITLDAFDRSITVQSQPWGWLIRKHTNIYPSSHANESFISVLLPLQFNRFIWKSIHAIILKVNKNKFERITKRDQEILAFFFFFFSKISFNEWRMYFFF